MRRFDGAVAGVSKSEVAIEEGGVRARFVVVVVVVVRDEVEGWEEREVGLYLEGMGWGEGRW